MTRTLDLSVLQSMFGDDIPLRNAILQEFTNFAAPYVQELNDALQSSNRAGIRHLAHKLKSSARTVGANELAEACANLESAAAESEWETLQAYAASIKQELDSALAAIARL